MQPRLVVSEPGDEYEREADRVADQIMQMHENGSVSSIGGNGVSIQRRVQEASTPSISTLQRAEAGDGEPSADGDMPREEGSRCPSWRADPQSISKRAGEFYARNQLTPPSQATVERIECEPPIANGNYGCYVHFSDGLVLRVIVRDTDIIVGTGPGPFTTEHPPPNTPLCWYEYSCPEGDLVLTVKKCQSSKPSKSSSPPAVAQRAAASGSADSVVASPVVHDVLASPGRPLDMTTRAFFEPRFGYDFGKVRVHADTAASESARSINALAYTVGSDIVFRAGQFNPGSHAGRRLLAHELAHVVQQNKDIGRRPSVYRKAAISANDKQSVEQGNTPRPQPTPPIDCAVEITPAHDCFALIGEMIAIQADMRENNLWLEKYRNDEIPWDVDAYGLRARHQGELRDKLQAKERIRADCCPSYEVPGEAPTANPTPSQTTPSAGPSPHGANQ